MKQEIRHRYVSKKDLNRDKICETSKPNKAEADRGLRTHTHDMRA